jgi:hypothetical protein
MLPAKSTSNNKYGGYQCQRMKGFRNSTFGAASPVKKFSPEQGRQWEKQWLAREKKAF